MLKVLIASLFVAASGYAYEWRQDPAGALYNGYNVNNSLGARQLPTTIDNFYVTNN